MSVRNEAIVGMPELTTINVLLPGSRQQHKYLVSSSYTPRVGEILMVPPQGLTYTEKNYLDELTPVPKTGRVVLMDMLAMIEPDSDVCYQLAILSQVLFLELTVQADSPHGAGFVPAGVGYLAPELLLI